MSSARLSIGLLAIALVSVWCTGIFGRGYWTPDEPREADISWRMSFQSDKAVPLLAGEAFCEKPPLTYWAAGAAIAAFGAGAESARLPNLLYALIGALAVGLLARRSAGALAGYAAAAAFGTFLLSYQVAIWLATDAPLTAAVAVALLGAYRGFYATGRAERLRGYGLMHAALAVGFLSKSAAAWMVPALTIATLTVWERRWKECIRWELYAGILIQAAVIGAWVWFVYTGPEGISHLKVFFWNNLAGRFVHVDAPQALQYASAHRNSPGKYFLELPMYLWPWTLLVAAAARRAWLARHAPSEDSRTVRFALASSLPALVLLSFAATARNIYLAPAMPGFALLLGWWCSESLCVHDRWDLRAVRASAVLMLIAVLVYAAAIVVIGAARWDALGIFAVLGVIGSGVLALRAEQSARRGQMRPGPAMLFFAYCILLTAPSLALYRQVDPGQDLASIGRAIGEDSAGRPLILMVPDETTRALVDMYARTSVAFVPAPMDASSIGTLGGLIAREPSAMVVAQLPGREMTDEVKRLGARIGIVVRTPTLQSPEWAAAAGLQVVRRYALPNGRRYVLLALVR